MGCAKRVIHAFIAFGEAGQAAALTYCANAIAPTGQNLVRVTLMSHIPDDAVVRRVEKIVQRDGQLDHTQSGPQMTTGHRHRIQHFGAQFFSKPGKIGLRNLLQIIRIVHLIEKRSVRSWAH